LPGCGEKKEKKGFSGDKKKEEKFMREGDGEEVDFSASTRLHLARIVLAAVAAIGGRGGEKRRGPKGET